MVQVAAAILIAYLVTFFLMPFIISLARQSKLYDVPDERKTHNYLISSLGGIGIFTGLAISLLLTADLKAGNSEFQYYLAAFFIIFIIGIIDDIFILRPWKKVIGQLVTAGLVTVKAHLVITDLHGLLGIHALGTAAAYGVTFFIIMLVVNAYNLIDGIDGLAGSLGLTACVLFALFFLVNHNFSYAILGFAMAGAILAFLVYNFYPARIFMGDSGSMLIGLVNTVLLLKFVGTAGTVADYPMPAAAAIGLSIIVIPVMDVLRVFCIRLYQKRSPFSPDRNHIHHLLLNKGLNHANVTLLLSGFGLAIIGGTFLFRQADVNILIACQTVLFFAALSVFRYTATSKKSLRVVSRHHDKHVAGKVEVYTLYTKKEAAVVKED